MSRRVGMNRVLAAARRQPTPAVMAGVLLATVAVGAFAGERPVPGPFYVLGAVVGATFALHAMGIVLVYRANRIINFAQIQMGVSAGLLFVRLVEHRTFVRGVAAVCPPCLRQPETLGDVLRGSSNAVFANLRQDPTFTASFPPTTPLTDQHLLEYFPPGFSAQDFAVSNAPGWLVQFNYWLAAVAAIAVATVLLWAVYMTVVRRFAQAPKLVLTVVTIATGFFVREISDPVLRFLFESSSSGRGDVAGETAGAASSAARLPLDWTLEWGSVVFSAAELIGLVVVIAVATALVLFLRRSSLGVVLRGAAENSERAETLGVDVGRVTAKAWLLAGVLSGLAAFLTVAATGAASGGGGYDDFVRSLAAAVGGGLASLPLVVLAALVVGVVDQAFAFVLGSEAPLAAVLLAIIVILLLVQRSKASRAEREASSTWQASRELRPVPKELRHLPAVRYAMRALATVAAVVVAGYPWFMSPSQTNAAMVTMVYAVVGLSMLVLTGWAGQISLGHMAFAAMGAWTVARLGWPLLVALPAAGVAGALLAVAVGVPSLRLRGLHLAISTLALGVAAPAVLFDPTLLGRGLGKTLDRPMFLGIDFDGDTAFYYFTVVVVAATVVATMGMRRSMYARALIAAKDNEQSAMSFGVNLTVSRVGAFAVSGFMAAFAGGVFAYAQHGINPIAFSPETSISVFLMTLIGGLGSLAGPLVGALYLGTLRLTESSAFGGFASTLLNPGLGVIIVLFVMPGGVVEGIHQMRDAWLRRLASRHRIHVPSLEGAARGPGELFPVLPNVKSSGGEVFVPRRFRLADQWVIEARRVAKAKARSSA